MDELHWLDAHALCEAIHTRRVSCREAMQATLAHIDALNPALNAVVSRTPTEDLLAQADACDAELGAGHASRRSRGFLHGVPLAVKDTAHAAGFPTTQGSPLLRDAVAGEDSVHVARMKAAGAIVIGKTNVPEFGLGSHTFNTVFGATANAWDASKSAGGSSGGAAVALAHRLVVLADGSDFMGSLRNPAGWNHVWGLRPSQGRVPAWPKPDVWVAQLGTDGPMARTVRDLAALLAVQAGHDARVPLSLRDAPGTSFMPGPAAWDKGLRGVRIGWLGHLSGHLAMEPGVLDVCEAALQRMAAAGAHVQTTALGFSAEAVWDAWLVWRRALSASSVGQVMHLPDARAQLKPEALWEYDGAQGLGFAEFMQASQVRTAFAAHLLTLFERFDMLALPVAQVWPFDVAERWPQQIAGRTMDTYHRWMECTLYATFAGLPALSVPAGFDASGRLPMGLQLIGRPAGERALLEAAAGYEGTNGELLARSPPSPRPSVAGGRGSESS